MATFYQKINFLIGLITGDIARTGPFYVTVDLTRRCNLQCPDCQYHSPFLNKSSINDQRTMDISVHRFEKLCNGIKAMGTKSLILTGEGEPFLHPRMFDLISVAKSRGFNQKTFTREGLVSMDEYCDCRFCCYAGDNMQVHRFFIWILPFVLGLKK